MSASIANAADFVDLCTLFGYYAEEHVVQTRDGYLLGLHRLGWRKGEGGTRVNAGQDSVKKKVVYLHHGLMMNSEVWVCLTEEERCLPFTLVEKGYDVWVRLSLSQVLRHYGLISGSLGTIVATSIPRNQPGFRRHPMVFGTFPWISSLSTTSLYVHFTVRCPSF